ncbi:MAG: hypothetical protein JXM73_12325 [Anaerolineae bacterium]|nr:hypothetical protein [Anaerolineae bacterium]
MRSVVRIVALLVALAVLLVVAAAAHADCCGCCPPPPAPCPSDPCVGISLTGPCPDDLEKSKECLLETPPYYVVINRQVECPNRTGTGCAPFILKHPECTDCEACQIDVEKELCKDELLGKVPAGETAVLYEMCCDGAGGWKFRIRILDNAGNCPLDPNNREWVTGLPPGTGINLPAPVIVGGLAFLGVAFLGVGIVVRRRTR